MDLAYVDELAKDNNGVNYLLVRQELFDGTVDAKGMNKKRFQSNASGIFDYDYKEEVTQENLGVQVNGICRTV